MIRATTPTHTFGLSFKDKPLERECIKCLLLTYKQGGKIVLEKTEEDVDFYGNVMTCTLTQEETLLFDPEKAMVKIQLRVLTTDNHAPASRTFRVPLEDVLNPKVLA